MAYTNGDFYHTLMWMQEALDHLDKEQNNSSVKKIDILDHLAYATSQVNNSIQCFFSCLIRKISDFFF
jgi:prolyl 4-hydroxylase